jgi:hypothetical protein
VRDLAVATAIMADGDGKAGALWCLYAKEDNPHTAGTHNHTIWEEQRQEARAIGEYYASEFHRR